MSMTPQQLVEEAKAQIAEIDALLSSPVYMG